METANNWIIFTHPLGAEKAATPTPPISKGAQRILSTKCKAGRERGWWRTGTDKLASYGLDTEVWISQNSMISDSNIIALEALLQTKSDKDLPDMRSEGVQPIYWAGTESGLMDIYNFPGISMPRTVRKAVVEWEQVFTGGSGCCRVRGGVGGSSSGRAEFAAACLALEDSFTHDQPIAVLTDSKGLMEPIGVSFSTRRQTDGPTKVERISTVYNGMGLAYSLLSRGLRKESNTDAP